MVQSKALHALAEVVPERALLVVEVGKLVEAVGEIEEIVFLCNKTLQKFEALAFRQQALDVGYAFVDGLLARILAGIRESLVLLKRAEPVLELRLDMGGELVLVIRPHVTKEFLPELAGFLNLGGIGRLALNQRDLPPLAGGGNLVKGTLDRDFRPGTNEVDFADDRKARHEQNRFQRGPPIGTAGEAILHEIMQDDGFARLRAQAQVVAKLLDGLRVAFLGLNGERLLADIVGAQDGLDFLERLAEEVLEIPHLGEGVSDEIFQPLTDSQSGGSGLGLNGLPTGVKRSVGDEIAHRGNQALKALAVLVGKIAQDALRRGIQGAVALA